MIFTILAVTRFAQFAAIAALFGLAVFPFCVAPAAGVERRFISALKACAVFSVGSQVLMLDAMVANMGGSLEAAFEWRMLRAGLTETLIGEIELARLGLALLILVLALKLQSGKSLPLSAASALLLGSVAFTGHSAMPGGDLAVLHRSADAIHLLTAGWWIGGLLGLALTMRSMGVELLDALHRFSRIGYVAISAIIVTGVFKSAILIGSFSAVLRTAYGWVLLIKLALFGLMGVLALSNRFQVTPALEDGKARPRWIGRLRVQVSMELGLGLVVLAVVGALGAMQPPVSQ